MKKSDETFFDSTVLSLEFGPTRFVGCCLRGTACVRRVPYNHRYNITMVVENENLMVTA